MASQATRTPLENQFVRQFAVPIDSTAVFPLVAGPYAGFTKQDYITDPRTSGLAYVGMIVADTSDNEVYILDSNRQWKDVGVTLNESFGVNNSGLLVKTGDNTFRVGGLDAGNNIGITNPSGLTSNPIINLSSSLSGLASIEVTGSDGISSSGTLTVASGVTFRNHLNVSGSGNFVSGLYSNGTLVSLSGHQHASTDITDFSEAVQDVLGDGNFTSTGFLRNGSGLEWTYSDSNNTLSIGITGIPVSLITDLDNYVNNTIDTKLVEGSGIQLLYDSGSEQLSISVTGIPTSTVNGLETLITTIGNSLISGNILAGSGTQLQYGNNQLTINNNIIGVSGIKVDHNNSTKQYTISLNDPTIQSSDVTDFNEAVDDRVASLLTGGDGITVNYTDGSDNLDIFVDDTVVRTTGNQTIVDNKIFQNGSVVVDMTQIEGGSGSSLFVTRNGSSITFLPRTAEGGGGATTTFISTIVTNEEDVPQNVDLYLPSSSGTLALISDINNKTFIAGNGLTGGGPLSSGSIRFDIGQGDGISVSANGIAVNNTVVRTTGVQTVSGIKTFASNVSLNGNRITNLALVPVSSTDAVSKGYVDSIKQGLDIKESVKVATTGNISDFADIVAGVSNNPPTTIDGISLNINDRVLVKNQTDATQNGIYIVMPDGNEHWARAADANEGGGSLGEADGANVTPGLFVFVEQGSTNADSGWVLTTDGEIYIDSTALHFSQFSGAGQIVDGSGLTKSGNTLNVGGTVGTIVVNADSITLDTVSRTNSSSSDGLTFLSSVTTDSYGRVTASSSGVVQNASSSTKGVASFDSNSFDVNTGAVSIRNSGINNSHLQYNYIQLGNVQQTLGSTYTSLVGLTSISGTSISSPTTLTFCVIDGGTP